uniref:Uncharacterized protein n=1 Tax=Arundo donax TaxID=35708 RepID=A0A0A9H8N6_ARUDO
MRIFNLVLLALIQIKA